MTVPEPDLPDKGDEKQSICKSAAEPGMRGGLVRRKLFAGWDACLQFSSYVLQLALQRLQHVQQLTAKGVSDGTIQNKLWISKPPP